MESLSLPSSFIRQSLRRRVECASPLGTLLLGRMTTLRAKRARLSLPITRWKKISRCTPR